VARMRMRWVRDLILSDLIKEASGYQTAKEAPRTVFDESRLLIFIGMDEKKL
jgi:hypothetical protein